MVKKKGYVFLMENLNILIKELEKVVHKLEKGGNITEEEIVRLLELIEKTTS